MSFCLPKFASDALLEKFRNKEITPESLVSMTSAERRAMFEQFVGPENAKQVNALLEKKLILKNQQLGIINWAKSITGLKPQVRQNILTKVDRMTEVLSPAEEAKFLEDLVETRLGFNVSVEEAGRLVDFSKDIEAKRQKITDDMPNGSTERLEYGLAKALFKEYVDELKLTKSTKLFESIKNNPKDAVYDLMGATKSILASLDNSFFGRQGLKVLTTNPSTWSKAFLKSWSDIGKALKGEKPTLAIRADILSRKNALNGKYESGKYAIDVLREEAYPSSLPERIPLFGRLFTASQEAYNGAALRMRADLADKFIEQAEKQGIDMLNDKVQAESIGKLVNSMTGRGNIGKLEVFGKEVNAALFSVKYLKSNWDFLTAHAFDSSMSKYAKKQASMNLVKTIGVTAGVLALADQLWPGSVDYDPRSANFGKIKIGATRFDVTGGMSSIAVLAARVATGEKKNSTTGKVTSLTSGKFGSSSRWDELLQFGQNKSSPAAGAVISWMRGKDFKGEKPTLESTAKSLVTPLPIPTWQELTTNPDAADPVVSMILSQLGIGVNTY